MPLETMRAAAEYLGCSVIELATADPSWRTMAIKVLRAKAAAKTHTGNGAT